jgi:hypothetical protein
MWYMGRFFDRFNVAQLCPMIPREADIWTLAFTSKRPNEGGALFVLCADFVAEVGNYQREGPARTS